jgi:hypothetical protein
MNARVPRSSLTDGRVIVACGALALAACLWFTPAARAAQLCPGTARASLMSALPSPLVIAPDASMQNSGSPDLTDQFIAGLRDAGINVGDQGTATMSLAAQVQRSGSAGTGQNTATGTYNDFSWVTGEQMSTGQESAIRGAVLTMSVQVMNNASASISWVLDMTCTVQTDDAKALARELGNTIGHSFGQASP